MWYKDCEGYSRRDMLRIGTAGIMGLTLSIWKVSDPPASTLPAVSTLQNVMW